MSAFIMALYLGARKVQTWQRASIPSGVYGIPPEQMVGTAGGTTYGYDKEGKPFLTKEAKLLLNDNFAGKPEGIHLMIGRRSYAAFGNSTGD